MLGENKHLLENFPYTFDLSVAKILVSTRCELLELLEIFIFNSNITKSLSSISMVSLTVGVFLVLRVLQSSQFFSCPSFPRGYSMIFSYCGPIELFMWVFHDLLLWAHRTISGTTHSQQNSSFFLLSGNVRPGIFLGTLISVVRSEFFITLVWVLVSIPKSLLVSHYIS